MLIWSIVSFCSAIPLMSVLLCEILSSLLRAQSCWLPWALHFLTLWLIHVISFLQLFLPVSLHSLNSKRKPSSGNCLVSNSHHSLPPSLDCFCFPGTGKRGPVDLALLREEVWDVLYPFGAVFTPSPHSSLSWTRIAFLLCASLQGFFIRVSGFELISQWFWIDL